MSGLKDSAYNIDPERLQRIHEAQRERERIRQEKAERARLTTDIAKQKQGVAAINNKLGELLRVTPQGLKETFKNSVTDAEQWSTNIQKIIKDLDIKGQNSSLKRQIGILHSHLDEGENYLKLLTKNFTKDADSIEKSLLEEMIDLNSKFDQNKELINKWCGLELVNKVGQDINDIERCIKEKKLKNAITLKNQVSQHLTHQIESVTKFSAVFNHYEEEKELIKPWFEEEIQTIDKRFESSKSLFTVEKYPELNKSLIEIQKILDVKIIEAKELDEKDSKRKYVLESLKKVCTSMGFEEVGFTIEGKGKANRIVYTIDTFSQGKIKFCLSLDSINADSGVVDSHCMSEFDKMSESLKKNFGVQTKFKRVHEQTDPIKFRQGERGGSGEDKVIHNRSD